MITNSRAFVATVVCGALAFMLVVGSARATVILDENFDDDAVGGVPNTADYLLGQVGSNPDSTIEIAGPGGAYTDPIGSPPNHSLVLDNFAGGAGPPFWPSFQFPVIGWTNEFPVVPLSKATIDFDLQMSAERPTDFWSYFEIRVGFTPFPSTVSDTILWNSWRIQSGSPLIYNNGGPAGFNSPNVSPIVPGQTMHVTYQIYDDQTWALWVDGSPILYNGQQKVPWMTNAAGSGMSNLFFFNAFNLNNAPSYVDNVVVKDVPEPSSVSLLAGAGLLGTLALVRRRRR